MNSILYCLFLLCNMVRPQAAQRVEVLADKKWPGQVWERTVLVPATALDDTSLSTLFDELTASEGRSFPVIKVTVYTDRRAASDDWRRKPLIEGSYARWKLFADEYMAQFGGRSPASAQLISINGNAVMRVRTTSGTVHERVLHGTDPTRLAIDDSVLRLADVAIGMQRNTRGKPASLAIGFYYWTADSYSKNTALDALRSRISVTGVQRVSVVLERWPWFIFHDDFPLVFPYATESEVPAEEDYVASLRIDCSTMFGEPASCQVYGGKRMQGPADPVRVK